jgi:acyl-CoA oxidase
MLHKFADAVNRAKEPAVKAVLARLAALFACSNIVDDSNWTGLLPHSQVVFVRQAVHELMDAIRPDAVALTDAFDIPDRVLGSVIGRADGNVYEALFDAATKSSLNRVDPFKGYDEFLRPHLDLEFLKRGNKVPPPAPKPAQAGRAKL